MHLLNYEVIELDSIVLDRFYCNNIYSKVWVLDVGKNIPSGLRATRLIARDHFTSSNLIGGKGGAMPSSLPTVLEGPTEYIRECNKMDVNSTWTYSYMALNWPCFIVTWTIFKNHLLEVGLTQHQETIALRTLIVVDVFYLIMREDPQE